jgi:hypothetical protein
MLERHREIDGEDAPFPGEVAHVKGAAVGLNTLAADGQPEAQTCAVGAPAFEGTEELLGKAVCQPSALVLDFDANPAGPCHGPEQDMPFAAAELERVAEEIRDGGREQQAIGVDGDPARHRRDGEVNASRGRLEGRRVLHVPDEVGQDDARAVLGAGAEPDFGQGTVGELPKTDQRSSEHRARPSADPPTTAAQDLEGHHRRREKVALLVCESGEPLHLGLRQRALAQVEKFRDGRADRFVEAAVEGAEFPGRHR